MPHDRDADRRVRCPVSGRVAGSDGSVDPDLDANFRLDAALPALAPRSERERDVLQLLALRGDGGEDAQLDRCAPHLGHKTSRTRISLVTPTTP
jgi:hypothetical protein